MIFIFPIGHQVNINRLPKITLGLIIANAIIFIFTWWPIRTEMPQYIRMFEQVISSGKSAIMYYAYQTRDNQPIENFNSLMKVSGKSNSDEALDNMRRVILTLPADSNSSWLRQFDQLIDFRDSMLIYQIGLTPANFRPYTLLTHMFAHGGWLHLLFNMWFLYLTGFCLENYWGRIYYLGVYLIGGIAAAFLHIGFNTTSWAPLIGASGAISAVMGAFAVRFATQKIQCAVVLGYIPVYKNLWIPAMALIAMFFLTDLYMAVKSMTMGQVGGTAFWAHIGGFGFGAAIAFIFKLQKIEEKFIRPELEKLPEYQHFEQHPDLEFAMNLMEKRQFLEAMAYTEKFLEAHPNHWEARVLKARILVNSGRPDESRAIYIELFEEARQRADKDLLIALNNEYFLFMPDAPLPAPVMLAIGRACFERGDYQKANTIFDKLLSNADDPDIKARGLFYLARIKAEQQKEIRVARKLYQQLLDQYPDHAWAASARANLANLPPDSSSDYPL